MRKGFVLSVQPLLFGGYEHGPQVSSSLRVSRPSVAVLGLLFMGGKRSKPSAPVGEVPKVSENKKTFGRRVGKAVGENKAKIVKATNKPNGKKARPVKQISLFHT